jgi:CDP-diacylglycerol--glycerol-3-phosphate 3-phosphatidyltransferase
MATPRHHGETFRMATGQITPYLNAILSRIAAILSFLHLTPNVLTIAGVFLNIAVALVLVTGRFFLGGWLFLIVSMSDLLDGILARQKNLVTPFGGFLDSVMDRFADSAILTSLSIHYALIQNVPCMFLAICCLIMAMITSYTRARAESLIPKCKVGFMERPERVILLAIGLLFDRVPICLLLMSAASLITIIDRIIYTNLQLRRAGGSETAQPVLERSR